MTKVRKGQAPDKLSREAFGDKFRGHIVDPAFRDEDAAIGRLEAIAWDAFNGSRKAPLTRKAGPEFADPDYDLSIATARAPAKSRRRSDSQNVAREVIETGAMRTRPCRRKRAMSRVRWWRL